MKKNGQRDMVDNIEGYPGYHVTTDGRIFTRKKMTSKGWILGKVWREKSTKFKPKTGYILTKLCRGKERKSMRVHRLVAMAYILNPDPKHFDFVCHKDNNRTNNCVENLYWGNHRVNMDQMVKDGNTYWTGRKRPEFSGDLHPMNKVKVSTYPFIYRQYRKGLSINKITEAYNDKYGLGVSASNIRRHLIYIKNHEEDFKKRHS